LFIVLQFALIRLAKADDADCVLGFHKHQRMNAPCHHAQRTPADFAVVAPNVHRVHRCLKIKSTDQLKTQTTLFNVLGWVKFNLNDSYCAPNKSKYGSMSVAFTRKFFVSLTAKVGDGKSSNFVTRKKTSVDQRFNGFPCVLAPNAPLCDAVTALAAAAQSGVTCERAPAATAPQGNTRPTTPEPELSKRSPSYDLWAVLIARIYEVLPLL
jgi:hypothetical protein